MIQEALQLPLLQYLEKIQKEKVGSQNENETPFGILFKVCKTIGQKFDEAGIKKRNERVVHLSYDSVKTVKGIDTWQKSDIHVDNI